MRRARATIRRVSNVVSGPATFGLIPRDHWFQPDWIDEERAAAGRQKMVDNNIIYGGASSLALLTRLSALALAA